jgi:signal peptidase I
MRTDTLDPSAGAEPNRRAPSLPLHAQAAAPSPLLPAVSLASRAALLEGELQALPGAQHGSAAHISAGEAGAPAHQTPTLECGWAETMARTIGLVRDLLSVALPAVLLALVVHLFLAQATVVFGRSMEPNLSPGQRLIVEKFSYRVRAPLRTDIVVVDLPHLDDMLVKRVVGLPGETIAVRQGLVYVNGAPLMEPFAHGVDRATMAPLRLGANEYFVLGDNRGDSNDSRYFGAVPRERIVGRVWLRYWPLHRLRLF